MEAYPDIRSQLDLYLRGELDTNRMSEIKALIDIDPAWYSTYHALLTEFRGIRMTALQDLTSRLQSLEKTIAPQGDLSPAPSSISTTNETEDLENNYTPPAKVLDTEETASLPLLIQGIRYTTLRDELRKLQDEERKGSGEVNGKKNDSRGSGERRVLRMRYWWAVAAGVVVMVVLAWPWIRPRTYAEKLIAKGFVVPPMTDLVRGGGEDSIQMVVQKAYGAYAEGKYELALEYFERIPIQEDENFYIFYGVTLLMTSEKSRAKVIIKDLINKWPNDNNKNIFKLILNGEEASN